MQRPDPNLYIVRPGDSLETIAERYTGNRNRAAEIVASNPHLPRRTFVVDGRPQRSLAGLAYGQTIFLPVGWSRYPRIRCGHIVLPTFIWEKQQMGEACFPNPSGSYYPGLRFNVTRGVLPRDIAKAFTGDPNRWPELRSVNYDTPGGFAMNRGKECVFTEWKIGKTVRIPSSWPLPVKGSGLWRYITRDAGLQRRAQMGVGADYGPSNPHPAAGTTCPAGGMITNVKPYVYQVQGDDTPFLVAQKLTGSGSRWKELRQANYDDPDGFKIDVYGTCNWANWYGKRLKIPASWPDPPSGSRLWDLMIQTGNGDGGNGGGGGGGGGLGETVGAKDETFVDKVPWWGWGIAGVAGGAGLLLLGNYVAKRRKERELLEGATTTTAFRP